MATTIRFKRGLESNLLNPGTPLLSAEPAFTTDTIKFYIGGPDNITKYEMGNRHVPFITTLVNKSSAYFPNTTTPLTTDFVTVTSYGNTFQGITYTPTETTKSSKWLVIINNPNAMLTLTLCAAKFFGKPLRSSQFPPPLKVKSTAGVGIEELTLDNDVPSNYCRYINNILRANNQFTVLSGTKGGVGGFSVIAKRCIFDDFYLEFEEKLTNITIADTRLRFRNRYLYSLKTADSNTIEDLFGGDILAGDGSIVLAADDRINLYSPNFSNAGTYTNVFSRWKKFKITIP